MKTKRLGILLALMMAVAVPTLAPAPVAAAPHRIEWQADYDRAASEAKQSSRPMLVLFTGSDWCGACKLLKREVLDKPEFAEAIGDKFVFVELDFPMKGQRGGDDMKRNRELQEKFGIKGFPTLVVLDASGKVLGTSVGYGGGGVAKVVQKIDQIAG